MKRAAILTALALSGCVMATIEEIKASPDRFALAASQARGAYADCLVDALDRIEFGLGGINLPPTRRDRAASSDIFLHGGLQFGFVYFIEIAEQGGALAIEGWVNSGVILNPGPESYLDVIRRRAENCAA